MEKLVREDFVVREESEPVRSRIPLYRQILESNARLSMAFVLLTTDLLSLLIAIIVGLQFRSLDTSLELYYKEIFSLLAITLAVAFAHKGLYPAVGLNYVDELREIVGTTSFTFLVLIGVTFLLKTTSVYSRLMLLLIWTLCLVLIPTGRYVVRRLFIHLHLWGEPVAIIGDMIKPVDLEDYFMRNLQLGLRPVVILRDEYFSDRKTNFGSLVSTAQIREIAHRLSINTALVVINDLNRVDSLVERYRFVFERVILIKDRNGSYSLNNLKSLDLSGILGLQVMNNLLNFWSQLTKRVVDGLASSLGLIMLGPFIGVISLLIRLDSPGPVFYRQKRLGRNGNLFELIKFRTMYQDAEQILAEKLGPDPELRREWDHYQKLKRDPRITRAGRVLRRFSLDELPQLWNVLSGEMSLVGPRPILLDQRELYGKFFKEYVQVSPGMTGLWQISGRNDTSFVRRAELDSEYIQRWSAWLDIFILIKTIKIVFWQDGAY